MPPCKVTALFEIMQYGVHRILTLDILQRKDYILENYFIRFAMLIIIDKLFVALFDKYLTVSLDKFRL